MLTEAVQDGGQAMRDPVGGSVEFHFVPILKLISTLLIMGVFNDEDVTHILKMIEPTVFSGRKTEEHTEESVKVKEQKELKPPPKVREEVQQEASEDDGLGEEEEEEEEDEEEMEEEEELEEMEPLTEQGEVESEHLNGEKGAEETEKEVKAVEKCGEAKEEHLDQGLFQMKLPESVKLQVRVSVSGVSAPPCTVGVVTVLPPCTCCTAGVYSAAVLL